MDKNAKNNTNSNNKNSNTNKADRVEFANEMDMDKNNKENKSK